MHTTGCSLRRRGGGENRSCPKWHGGAYTDQNQQKMFTAQGRANVFSAAKIAGDDANVPLQVSLSMGAKPSSITPVAACL